MITNKLNRRLRNEVVARLMLYLKTDNNSELARNLGCNSRQHLDICLKRGNIPTNRIINYALKEGINLSYLFGQQFYGTSLIATEEHKKLQKNTNKAYRKLIDVDRKLT